MDRVGLTLALMALVQPPFAAAPDSAWIQDPKPKPAAQLLEGVEMESALVYEADPKTQHLLRASFAGKDHARLWIGVGAEGMQVRLLRLRSGEHVFALRLESAESVELEGEQRDEALAQLELRRALLQFESFAWQGEDLARTVALGPLGSLRARFETRQSTRPCELEFLDPKGHVQDACRAIRWDASGSSPTPSALELWHEAARVWVETVRRVQPMTSTRDAFWPRDRLEGETPPGTWNVIQTPSPEYAARRFPLPANATWASARKEIERLRSEWTPRLASLGLELEKRGTLELDEQLHPRFVVLRLASVVEKLPTGFERVAGRSAVGTPLEGLEQVEAGALRALREKVPAGVKTGPPYVRWALDPGGPKQVLLLLSWTTAK